MRQREIEELRRHLAELTERLEMRIKRKDDLIARRMRELLNPEETEW